MQHTSSNMRIWPERGGGGGVLLKRDRGKEQPCATALTAALLADGPKRSTCGGDRTAAGGVLTLHVRADSARLHPAIDI